MLEDRTLLSALVVTTLNDFPTEGELTLREAIEMANGIGTFGTFEANLPVTAIEFEEGLEGTIELVQGQMHIASGVTITGLGADLITIDAGGESRIFEIGAGMSVEISGLTLTGGKAEGLDGAGGAIRNGGILTVAESTLTGNAAHIGGGIWSVGTLTVIGSTLSANIADRSSGGGIANRGGDLTVIGSTLSGNVGAFQGGGIYNLSATVTVSDSILTDNVATGTNNGGGGGIRSNAGSVTVTGSTLSGNSAPNSFGSGGGGGGGAIYTSDGAELTITTSILSGNSSAQGFGGAVLALSGADQSAQITVAESSFTGNSTEASGGAIAVEGMLTVEESTFDANSGDIGGGGIWSRETLTVRESTFTGNVGGTRGGAILSSNPAGTLEVFDSTFNGNQGGNQGGGAVWSNASLLSVIRATLIDNTAEGRGGAVYAGPDVGGGATLTVEESTLSNNSTERGGGGLYISNAVTATVSGSTFSGNAAGDFGGGAIRTFGTLTVTGSTFSGNSTEGHGGAIWNERTLTLSETTFTGNQADLDGGALYTHWPSEETQTIVNSIFSDNTSERSGGAIWAPKSATLSVSGSTFTSNTAAVVGGGIHVEPRSWFEATHDTLSVSDSTFSNNVANENGGGIHVSIDTTAVISGSTFTNNVALRSGGGISNAGILTLTNSTFSGNRADMSGGGLMSFGARPATVVTNSTFVLNRADADGENVGNGGGINATNTEFALYNTLVAGNVRGEEGADLPNDVFSSIGLPESAHNLIGDAASSGGLVDGENGNIVGAALEDVLDPELRDNGGPTLTHALILGSPAIDAGSDALAVDADGQPLSTDQRGSGFARIHNASVDIGAFEILVPNRPPVAVDDQFEMDWNTSLTMDVLANDHDPDGDELQAIIESIPEHGTLAQNPDGTLTYTPDAGFYGTDSFTYRAFDGEFDSDLATVTITVAPAVEIDVNPGDENNTIELKNKSEVAVAILSTDGFDATTQVDVASLTFGVTGDEDSLITHHRHGPKVRFEDVNGNGLLDLIVYFDAGLAGFQPDDDTAILKGTFTDAEPFESQQSVVVVTSGGGGGKGGGNGGGNKGGKK